MAKLYYNGVLLPEIPADLLSSYPYRWISVKGSIYNLMLSPYPWYRKNENLYTQTSTYVWYKTTETAESWGFHKTFTDEGAFNYESNLVWANHDIPDGSATATEIYFEGSEPLSEFPEEPEEPEAPETQYAERYSILGSILVGTARQIMRLTDSTTKVKPEEFEPKLEGINIQLQELTVTATEEVQTITPPSGVYGFSKVIVEAVEDSGTSGGGGTPGGGEGGDDPEPEIKYPSFEDSTLVYEATTMEVPTGRYLYGTNKISLPACPYTFPYQFYNYGSSRVIYQCTAMPYLNGTTMRAIGPLQKIQYTYSSNNDIWVASDIVTHSTASETTVGTYSNGYLYWSNFDICKKDGTLVQAAREMKPETVVTSTYAPAAMDAVYTVTGDTVASLGATVYQITGEQATNPDAMIAALNRFAAVNKPKEETTE